MRLVWFCALQVGSRFRTFILVLYCENEDAAPKCCQGSFELIAEGYCNGPEGSPQEVNGRVRCGLLDEASCRSDCAVLQQCIGYAFDPSECNGRCFLYGADIDQIENSELTNLFVGNIHPDISFQWEGYPQLNAILGHSASGHPGVACMKKLGKRSATPTRSHFNSHAHVKLRDFAHCSRTRLTAWQTCV